MASYRLTRGDFQARFDSLGRLTHLGAPDRIRDIPTPFHTTGPIREGHWYVNCGRRDLFFDPEATKREYDFDAATLTLRSEVRGYGGWFGLDLERTYQLEHGLVRCDFTLRNFMPKAAEGSVTAAAPIARLRYSTGVNCWTDFSSDWAHRPFPTHLRCEQGFFWGAMVSAAHDVVGFFSATKADGWHVVYEGPGEQRVRSVEIDFINGLDRHPDRWTHQEVRLDRTHPSYHGRFYAGRFGSVEEFWQKAADVLGVAFVAPPRCAGFVGEDLRLPVIGPAGVAVRARMRDEAPRPAAGGDPTPPAPAEGAIEGGWLTLPLRGPTGWKIVELDAGGFSTEARVWQHAGWEETLSVAARYAADRKPPTAYNGESVLALIPIAQAGGPLGDEHCRRRAAELIERFYRDDLDPATGRNRHDHHRLQNYGSLLDALRIAHERLGLDDAVLDRGHLSARQMMSLQRSDGNFYRHHNIYNNVIHPVKSLFDWGLYLRRRGRAEQAREALASAGRAYLALAAAGDDSQTEGSDHYEDGMTACAAYQIAAMAPHFENPRRHLETAAAIYDRRRMLKCRVPDSRYFGATLRHWEGYWAMGLGEGMLGGHGWNAWSASLAHALFMATGAWHYLLDAYATVANCLQAVDLDRKAFHFGFAIDPCWHDYFGLGGQHPGERYIPVPDEVTVACEANQVFLTLDSSFYRQTYVKLAGGRTQVLNGRLLHGSRESVDLESFALKLDEVVVIGLAGGEPMPRITVRGEPARVVVAGDLTSVVASGVSQGGARL